MNPLVHYIQYGAKEARDPHPQFGADWYQEEVSRLRWEPTDPLLRYMTAALLHKSALLDPVWYRQTYPDLRDTPVDVARHYLEHGAAEGRNPGPFFDTNFYLGQNPDVVAAGMNPLVHYIRYGAKEARDPHPQFGADWYQEQVSRLRWVTDRPAPALYDRSAPAQICPGGPGLVSADLSGSSRHAGRRRAPLSRTWRRRRA